MKIVLQPSYSDPSHSPELTNARLVIQVVEAVDITPAIFVHERYPILQADGPIQETRFVTVAKPGDLCVYPVGQPSMESNLPPYFRLNCVDLTFNSPEILDETFSAIVSDVRALINAMVKLERLTIQDAIVIEA